MQFSELRGSIAPPLATRLGLSQKDERAIVDVQCKTNVLCSIVVTTSAAIIYIGEEGRVSYHRRSQGAMPPQNF